MRESFLRPLRVHLSIQQKKIALVALAIFSFLAVCSLRYFFCIKAKKGLPNDGNILQKEVVKQNALSPQAGLNQADEATKIPDFSHQPQEDKNGKGDRNQKVEDSHNEMEDLLPEVFEQDKVLPSPPPEELIFPNNKKIEGNFLQKLVSKQNALSQAVLKKADEVTKIVDFSNQVQKDKNGKEDQNHQVEDSRNGMEDLLPEDFEQDKVLLSPTPKNSNCPNNRIIEGNILQEKVFEQNALSPQAGLKEADEVTKTPDFSNQVQEDKDDKGDQHHKVGDSHKETEDLLPEVIEQDENLLSPPPEELNPLNNEIIEEATIESLPPEILAIIFKFLPISCRANRVCRQWKQLFDEADPIKLLQAGCFFKALKHRPLSYYAKDQKEFLKIKAAIQAGSSTLWIDKWMQQCKSEAEETCLWQNLWLNDFSTNVNVRYPKIQEIVSLLNQNNISVFFTSIHFENLIESLSDEVIESIREPIKEAIRLDYIKINNSLLPSFLRNLEILSFIVRKDGMALQYVPDGMCTAELCRLAVGTNGMALQYVPLEMRTAELCLAAVQKNGSALLHVPEEKRTEELSLLAYKEVGWALYYISEEKRTAELCLEAVLKNVSALQFVPEEKRTADLCLLAIGIDGMALQYLPVEKRTAELCLAAVQKNVSALEHVPGEELTNELFLEAFHKDISAPVIYQQGQGVEAKNYML